MTDKMTTEDMWDFLLQNVSVSEDTLQVVSAICGYSRKTMEAVLYAVTGYRGFDQVPPEEID